VFVEPLAPTMRLHESAVDAIRQYIIKEQLKPGDMLPSERQIQQLLGISRSTLREALRVLQRMGLIEARQGKGLIVREMDLRPMVETFVSHLELLDDSSFHHLHGLRNIIELGAAEQAAKQRTPEDLARMEAVLASMRGRMERQELVLEEDMGFHDVLVQATHNPLLETLYSCLTPFLVEVRVQRELTQEELNSCEVEHTAIYEAIRDRDAARAIRLMQEHMEGIATQFSFDIHSGEPDK
jgi:GntR family transcriptional repressor for pyruvate dehydrogenase complex